MNVTVLATHEFLFAAKTTQQHNCGGDKEDAEDSNKRASDST